MSKTRMALAACIAVSAVCLEVQAQQDATQAPKIAPQAEQLLKKMTDFLGSQKRFSFNAENETEAVLKSGQKLEFNAGALVSVERPNKIRSDRKGEIAENLSFYYDGKNATLFGRGVGFYASTPAPKSIDQTIDFMREKLDIDAPGADLLYSDSFKVLTEDVVSGRYIGKAQIDGVPVHHLAFKGNQTDWQIWIDDGEKPLPRKYLITSKKVTGQPEFSVRFRDWNLAPQFDDQTFSFTPPPDASRIQFAGVPESKPKKNQG